MERSTFGQRCGRMASGVLLSEIPPRIVSRLPRLASYLLGGMGCPHSLDSQLNFSDDTPTKEVFVALL